MKAIALQQYGDALAPGTFEQIKLATPECTSDHVLIKVAASSINPLDYKIRCGLLKQLNPNLPTVSHGDVAGTVEAVGDNVTRFKVGDEVYGCAGGIINRPGALAEYMLAEASLLAHKPQSLSLEESATLPLVAITAWEGLVKYAKCEKEQSVLIYGGTGGVGHIALQLAKALGAEVTTTAGSEEKTAICQQLGADHVFNYKTTNAIDYIEQHRAGSCFDIVFDTVGGYNLTQSMPAVDIDGQLITPWIQGDVNLLPLYFKSASLHFILMLNPMLNNRKCEQHGIFLQKIAALVDEGKIKPLIDNKTFTFSEIGKAHHYAEQGENIGKILLINTL